MSNFYTVITYIAAVLAIGCSSGGGGQEDDGQGATAASKYTEEEARNLSPVAEVCVTGEVEQVEMPRNRGRGNNHTETVTVDNREYFPAYIRGDINFDGQVNREDSMIANRKLYKRAYQTECPAVFDVGGDIKTYVPDGWLTAQDLWIFNELKTKGVINFPTDLICSFDCDVIDHMDPSNKK